MEWQNLYQHTKSAEKFGSISKDRQALTHAIVAGLLQHLVPDACSARIGNIFRVLDRDQSHTLTPDDFTNVHHPAVNAKLRGLLTQLRDIMDANEDGIIDEQELMVRLFLQYMRL